jgi:Superinfection immunity protein
MPSIQDIAIGFFGYIIFGVFGLAALLFYFLPTFIARKKQNFAAIFALNFLLGWTFIGWVLALVWSLTKENTR